MRVPDTEPEWYSGGVERLWLSPLPDLWRRSQAEAGGQVERPRGVTNLLLREKCWGRARGVAVGARAES